MAQKSVPMKPIVKKPVWHRVSPPLRDMIKASEGVNIEIKEVREIENELDFHPNITKLNQPDKLSAKQRGFAPKGEVLNVLANFDGVDNIDGVAPPDTQGDVNESYYLQTTNGHSIIKDKNGNTVKAAFKTSDFWAGSGYDDLNNGDAVALWDEDAQRWLVTQFYLPSSGDKYLLIAVSTTSDPTGSYNQYAYPYTDMPDYPKWAVWPDGYYMGANAFSGNNYAGAYVTAFDRQAMINGDANPASVTFGPDANLWSIFPADADVFPTYGDPCPFLSDQVSSTSGNNKVYIYNFHVDWNNTNNSSFTLGNTITVSNYGLFSNDTQVPQSGTTQKLDLLQSRIMYRPYYRKFSDHESLLMCRTVNDGGVAAIRWYEFRKSGSNWTLYQEGTYNPGDGLWRWMPSIAMNANGDIAIGYSVSSSSKYPSIRVVARHSNDQLGVMTTNEKEVLTGSASQTGASRWGDYSMMSVDPSDNTSFWYTTEYSSGSWNWKTRITHFEIPSACTGPSTQASNFSATNIQDNQMTINWTRGNGNRVLVVARKASAVNADPADGSTYSANSVFGSGSQLGSGNYVVYDGTGTSVTVTGLDLGTQYYYAIYEYYTSEVCYNATELTGNAQTTGEAPCTPCYSYGNTSYATSITRVLFNTIDNTSAKPTDANGNAYSDYTSQTTEVNLNSSYDLTVQVNTDGNYTVNSKVWIDWNHNCDFTDPGEEYDLGTAKNVSNGATSNSPLTISVPSDAYVGEVTMRVSAKYNAAPTACETGFDGEVEDYTIIVANGGGDTEPPVAPTNLASSNITTNSVDLSWNASTDNVGVTGYAIYKNGSLLSTTTGTSYSVTGLSPNTTYSFYVKAYDAAGNYSSASSTLNVTTLDEADTQAPTAPTNLAYANLTQISVDLSWTASSDNVGVTGYQIYKNGSLLTTTTGTSYSVNGLSASTSYSFYVKAYDAAGNVSSASNTVSFTTPAPELSYCSSKGNNATEEWIGRVIFGSIDNTSGGNGGYADFTNMSTTVALGANVTITIYPEWSGTVYSEGEAVWIDFNQDGDFDDAGEQVVSLTASKTSPVSSSFTIPASALTGTTRMRVSLKYNGIPSPCETFSYGEVEDYTVNIVQGTSDNEAPTAPSNLAASNVAQTTLTLCWNASTDNVGVAKYNIYQDGSLVGYIDAANTCANISSLTSGTTYHFYVTAVDAAGNESSASNTVTVTTLQSSVTYCSSKGTNVNYEWINQVKFNTINKTSGSNGGYADFTGISTNVNKGSSYSISIYPGFASSSYNEGYAVWIDYNHDGDFEDNGELVYSHSKTSSSVSGTITIPSSAASGSTRMRVAMTYNATPSDPCATFTYGEVEDYTINIGAKAMADVENVVNFEKISVYPNPVSGVLNIDISQEINEGAKLLIYSANGILVNNSTITSQSVKIDVTDLPAGLYNIKVISGENIYNANFVKF